MELSDRQVVLWLTNLYSPGALADTAMRELLRFHGGSGWGSDFEVSRNAREFLRSMIDRLQPHPYAHEDLWRPYRVLSLSFVEQFPFHAVARLLCMSTRQLTRERARAIALLRSELETPPPEKYGA